MWRPLVTAESRSRLRTVVVRRSPGTFAMIRNRRSALESSQSNDEFALSGAV